LFPGTSSQITERERAGTAAGTPAELDLAARGNSTAPPRELDRAAVGTRPRRIRKNKKSRGASAASGQGEGGEAQAVSSAH